MAPSNKVFTRMVNKWGKRKAIRMYFAHQMNPTGKGGSEPDNTPEPKESKVEPRSNNL